MNSTLRTLALVLGLILVATPAFAADGDGNWGVFPGTGAFAAGLIILGASYGFGKIGAAALEGIARQPEAANDIRGAMIVAAALLEGATFFALVITILKA